MCSVYVREDFTDRMLAAAETASATAVCRIAEGEAMAALARRSRDNPADAGAIDTVRCRLHDDWNDCAIVEISQAMVELAGDDADTFARRGYDSVPLAAARTLDQASREQVQFGGFARHLQKAARILGLESMFLPDPLG
ncbi:PIN domain-containing protein [Thiocapsa bogorovii]|uniref:VapC toxin family PIN domain ribonuclease n=1 Tax=Thiocapsa bogorovii TaxID=521689 RepID=UPI001E5D5E36|nr:VapC toxin family PIN domain ribonuclease [Thiocapsa bogorovii]UHD15504.1 VapC toxin family PIN domain ribonuclease [Thiocapsa bogorovii]